MVVDLKTFAIETDKTNLYLMNRPYERKGKYLSLVSQVPSRSPLSRDGRRLAPTLGVNSSRFPSPVVSLGSGGGGGGWSVTVRVLGP